MNPEMSDIHFFWPNMGGFAMEIRIVLTIFLGLGLTM